MHEFLRREIHFLRRPLNLTSRLLMIVAAGFVVAAVFLPLWKIHLVAPQYREGLSLHIYSYQLVGGNRGQDLVEINGLNHYIGMKPLQQADLVEMTWLPFVFGIFALLSLRAAVIGRMASLIDLGVLFLYFGAFSMGNFYYRLYSYGHHLDPRAALRREGDRPSAWPGLRDRQVGDQGRADGRRRGRRQARQGCQVRAEEEDRR